MCGHSYMDGNIFTLTYFSLLALNNQRATNLLTDQSRASTERALTLWTNRRAGYERGSKWRLEDAHLTCSWLPSVPTRNVNTSRRESRTVRVRSLRE